MVNMLIITQFIMMIAFISYIVINNLRLKKIFNELENMNLEQGKISFRLFITEKRQKLSYEQKNEVKIG